MKTIGVIPARFGSTRFPGKPLRPILGKPLLQWVIEGAQTARSLAEVWVATDHKEIFALAEAAGARAVLTPSDLPSGSDRVHHAARDTDADVIVNIQGDEPLITGDLLDDLVEPMRADPGLAMATLACPLEPGDLDNRNAAKIVLNSRSEAIYFSRWPIPYSRIDAPAQGAIGLKHIGLYAYRKSFLTEFCAHGPTPLESAEGLEQLRALYLGARIKVVPTNHESIGVDVPGDVERVENRLRGRPARKA